MAEASAADPNLVISHMEVLTGNHENLAEGFKLQFKRLTVLVGVNGSGKSAVLRAILKAAEKPRTSGLNTIFTPDAEVGFFQHWNALNIASMGVERTDTTGTASEASRKRFQKRLEDIQKTLWQRYLNYRFVPGNVQTAEVPPAATEIDRMWHTLRDSFEATATTSTENPEGELKKQVLDFIAKEFRAGGTHVSDLASARSTIEKLLNRLVGANQDRRKALDQLKKYLHGEGFTPSLDLQRYFEDGKFGLSAPLQFNIGSPGTPTYTQTYSELDLSSGEKIQLLCLLWRHPSMHAETGILLLDEPDAHLHVDLCREFIESLTKLIETQNIQVIMTSHDATTVRFLPSDKSGIAPAIFLLRAGKQPLSIGRAAAVKSLTQNLVMVSEPAAMVFCEAPDDAHFYTFLHQRFSQICPDLRPNPLKRIVQVKRLVERFADVPGLSDFTKQIRGIIDLDNLKSRALDRDILTKQLVTGERYSLENYTFDPIVVSAYLLHLIEKDRNVFSEGNWRMCLGTSPDKDAALKELLKCLYMSAGPLVFPNHIWIQRKPLLQHIIDTWAKLVLARITAFLADPTLFTLPNWKDRMHIKPAIVRTAQREYYKYPLTTEDERSSLHDVRISWLDITLKYPAALLFMKGHHLAGIYGTLCPALLETKSLLRRAEAMLPPFEDLVNIFQDLQDFGTED
ncbi:hypothetical protein HKX48_009171 [Thoreauomyces humboldtii]|nr:hypothetical protein HKX48_009171 [Thoreauomyces humboldtii]